MYGYIYKTTNIETGKIYIGQKKSHKFLGNSYLGSGVRLNSSIKCYGKQAFIVELVEECDSREALNEREKYWIEFFDSRNPDIGYNIAKGGDGTDGSPIWNKDLTKETDSRLIQSQGAILKRAQSLHIAHAEGKFKYDEMFSSDVRHRMSEKAKQRKHLPTTANTLGYTDGQHYKMINAEDISLYESNGWWHGRPESYKGKEPPNKGKKGLQSSNKKGKITIYYPGLPEIKNKYILISEYEFYYTQGWSRGSRKVKNCIQ